MNEILQAIIGNPVAAIIIGSPIGLMVLGIVYQSLLKIFLSTKNIDKLGDSIRDMVKKLEKKDPEAGKLTRQKVIDICNEIIKDLQNI